MAEPQVELLDGYRLTAGLSHGDLFLRYFELGGMSSALELEAFLYGALEPSAHDREVIAHALNERFVELGGNHPVPYLSHTDTPHPAGRIEHGEPSRSSSEEPENHDERQQR